MLRAGTGSRSLSRSAALPVAGLLAAITLASAAPARALPPDPEQLVTAAPADDTDDRAQPYVLPRVMTASPGPPALFVLSSGGYGYTGSVLGAADAHHRVAGSLMLDGRRCAGWAWRCDWMGVTTSMSFPVSLVTRDWWAIRGSTCASTGPWARRWRSARARASGFPGAALRRWTRRRCRPSCWGR